MDELGIPELDRRSSQLAVTPMSKIDELAMEKSCGWYQFLPVVPERYVLISREE